MGAAIGCCESTLREQFHTLGGGSDMEKSHFSDTTHAPKSGTVGDISSSTNATAAAAAAAAARVKQSSKASGNQTFGLLKFATLSVVGCSEDGNAINQDACSVVAFDSTASSKSGVIFGVYDGHGKIGNTAAAFVRDNLPDTVGRYKVFEHTSYNTISSLLQKSFSEVNARLITEFNADISMSGTTATIALFHGSKICVANVGDSRCILARDFGGKLQASEISSLHKTTVAAEMRRVTERGARVALLEGSPQPRVFLPTADVPGLPITRSFGDKLSHSIGVCADPQPFLHHIQPEDKFMIMATGGLWEFLSPFQACEIVNSCGSDAAAACQKLCEEATSRWTLAGSFVDDITVIIVLLA